MSTPTTDRQDEYRSRMPDPSRFIPELAAVPGATTKVIRNGSIPQVTIDLLQLRAGQLVCSTYLTVMQTDSLRKAGESEERITAVATWQNAPCFSAAERAALELVEAVLTPNPSGERVSDELHARAAVHYDDKALWTLTLAISQVGYFIPVALVGKPVPGRGAGNGYTS